jgi:uncharacterized protein with PQ loop repeat
MTVYNDIMNFLIVIGPSIGYISQGIKFKINKKSKGFCLSMCLKTILSSIFKIYFWVGKRYNIYLLYQAILVLLLQYYIIIFYLKYSEKDCMKLVQWQKNNKFSKTLKNFFDLKKFWGWDNLFSFLFYSVVLGILIGFVCFIFGIHNKIFMEILGYIATGIDVFLGLPQIYTNYKLQNARSLSTIMIASFLLGDTFRTYYYVHTKSPFQFILCGFMQVSINIILMLQIFYYRLKGKRNKSFKKPKVEIQLSTSL